MSTSAEQPATGAPLTLYLVKRLELAIRALLDDALRPLGLTTLQYTALTVLEASGALSSAQLARRSFLRPQTMHEMVLALEKRGLIERTPKADNKRVLLASLTAAGRALLAACAPAVGEVERELLADLSPGQRATFREGLQHGVLALGTLAEARRTPQDS
ncbi:MarR family transcriptional regulator [Amycolatopsis sp., V23-08]|uniref:MarR family transcriptional regulator n=1 Tax=Amycolatopsis heterodermiae TaxID=3110235 RepID=A0ABU5R7G5_9PSEU|nr:MarR family transcriptional regulator [Amycolatopsis sp., V23-08]MEA5361579.1 MarR family transcriptional regulator [Amycolatopsis sp., V23-08]